MSAFSRTGIVNWKEPSRITDLADRCDMSPGGVHWVVSLLQDKGYVETHEGKLINCRGVRARHVRLFSNGNSSDDGNHYTEVEVYGQPVQ